MLVDSGANVSIISKDTLEKWPYFVRPKIVPVQNTLITVTGESSPFLGKAEMEITVGKHKIDHEFLIADIKQDGILGLDFLIANKCDIVFSQGYITLRGEKIPCYFNSDNSKPTCCRVAVGETVVVPPETEVIVSGKALDVISNDCVGMLEPVEKFVDKTGLMVAQVLVQPVLGKVPVRLANFSSEPRKVYENTVTALYEPVNVIEDKLTGNATQKTEMNVVNEVPEHLQELYERSSKGLDSHQQQVLKKFLIQEQDVFSKSSCDIGSTDLVTHHIDTGNSKPIKTYPYRIPLAKRKVAEDEIKKMAENGIIEPASSPWLSPIQMVSKANSNEVRFCCDFRKLNDVTVKEFQPLPRIDDNLDALSGSKWFSCLDLMKGFWQIEIDPESRPKTAFSLQGGQQWQFRKLAFGLCNAPSAFTRLMQLALSGLIWNILVLYLDDIIVHAKTFDEAVENLKITCERLRKANLKLHPKKCQLFQKQVTFLGHVINENGTAANPEKVKAVTEWPTPRSAKQVKSFLGLVSYYRKYVPKCSSIAKPLHELSEKGKRFQWTPECDKAFNELKHALTSSPVLTYPTDHDPFILETDASHSAMGAVLTQVQNGEEKVIAYFSKCFSKAERGYCVTRKELNAVVLSVKHFHHYLYGRKFTIRTDHASLRWLTNFRNLEGQLCRWLNVLSTYDYEIVYRPGRLHSNSDALSRRPCIDNNCVYCEKAENRFEHGCEDSENDYIPTPNHNIMVNQVLSKDPEPKLSEKDSPVRLKSSTLLLMLVLLGIVIVKEPVVGIMVALYMIWKLTDLEFDLVFTKLSDRFSKLACDKCSLMKVRRDVVRRKERDCISLRETTNVVCAKQLNVADRRKPIQNGIEVRSVVSDINSDGMNSSGSGSLNSSGSEEIHGVPLKQACDTAQKFKKVRNSSDKNSGSKNGDNQVENSIRSIESSMNPDETCMPGPSNAQDNLKGCSEDVKESSSSESSWLR